MKYMGSKRRIAKEILPIILKDRKESQLYIEPFVGGANSFQEVCEPKIGYDINPYLIKYLDAASQGYLPPRKVSKEDYLTLKKDWDADPVLAGYAMFALTFGCDPNGGYVTYECQDRNRRAHKDETGYLDAVKNNKKLKGARFICKDYLQISLPDNPCIIYCDPPYQGTTNYKTQFDHSEFWDWCRKVVKRGHKVFISEYNAPDDFVCVWKKEARNSLNNKKVSVREERLFVHISQY